MKLVVYALTFVFMGMTTAYADDYNFDQGFQERAEPQCISTFPAMSEWYFSEGSNGASPLDAEIGVPRDQGSIGWCYAYAAADILSQRHRKKVSATQLATIYYDSSLLGGLQKIFTSQKEGGFIDIVLKSARKKSLCRENDFPTNGNYDQLRDVRCNNPLSQNDTFSVATVSAKGLNSGYQVFASMDQQLMKRQLVGIHYKMNVIYNNSPSTAGWADHASTVVARHWNASTRTCDYLVRNTWGTRCLARNCKGGYYSVPESVMNKALQEVIYIR